jgi:glycosyltransferase involved in cell wall biosynthesis
MFHGAPASSFQTVGFRSAIAHFDAVIVHSEFSKRRAVEQGWLAEDKIHVIPHGSLEYYRSLSSAQQSPPAGESTILFFGNLKAYKGVDILIRAFAQLPHSLVSSTRLVIAGKPMMDVTGIQQLSHELGIDGRITWRLGHVQEADVPELFQAATVVALPYREIDQSGVLMTAVAFEKPVVASQVGGIAETIRDGVHGYLVQPEDVSGLTAALTAVLNNPQRRLAMEKAVGDLRKGVLGWDNIAMKTIKLYAELLRG